MKRWMAGLATGLVLTVTFGGAAEAQYGGGNPPTRTPPEESEVGGVVVTPRSTVPQDVSSSSTVPPARPTTGEPEVGGVVITPPVQNPPQVQGVQEVARPQTEVLGVTVTRGLLVRTGQEAAPYAVAGAGLVAIGAMFVAAARRRGGAGIPVA